MKLNVFIAKSGYCSRRKAVLLIKEGKVSLNSKTVLLPWLDVAGADAVKIDGKQLTVKKDSYVILNKPKGVTSTLADRFAESKITEFIPEEFGRLYPVGRLDRDSRGLLILTNDGDLCHRLTHPSFEVEKEYDVVINGKIGKDTIGRLTRGVTDGEDTLKVKSATIEARDESTTGLKLVVSEGKKRHLRRLFQSLGYEVLDLKRVRIGNLKLGTLKEGAFKTIDKKTIYKSTLGSLPGQ